MITLYYKPGACSTANHFALEESGVDYEAIPVNLQDPDDALAIKVRRLNPMAMTPTIVLDDGTVLTQNMATLPFIADLAPEKALFPARGTMERVLAESWLSFIASDLHPRMVEAVWVWAGDEQARGKLQNFYEERVSLPLKVLEDRLADRPYILGGTYSVIDGYALIALDWSPLGRLSLDAYPNILAFLQRVAARPAIQLVRQLEGPPDWAGDHERALPQV